MAAQGPLHPLPTDLNALTGLASQSSFAALSTVEAMIARLESARATLTNGEVPLAGLLQMKNYAKTQEAVVAKAMKDWSSAVSKWAKGVDKQKFATPLTPLFPTPDNTPPFSSDVATTSLNETIALHLSRLGAFSTLASFLEETSTPSPPLETLSALQELHAILAELNNGTCTQALAWVTHPEHEGCDPHQDLLFALRKEEYIRLLLSSSDLSESAPLLRPPSHSASSPSALVYGGMYFRPLYTPSRAAEIEALLTSPLYLPPSRLISSPYADLFKHHLGASGERPAPPPPELLTQFTEAFLVSVGLPKEDPLKIVTDIGGGGAVSRLVKVGKVMKEGKVNWSSGGELPVEIPLPPSRIYHSVFSCPVSKEATTPSNPPMLLPCGHVIAKESLMKLGRGTPTLKCPYCPVVSQIEKAVRAESEPKKELNHKDSVEIQGPSMISDEENQLDGVFGPRDPNGPNYTNTGWFRTSILMMKSQIGLGVLSIPFVFQTIGMVPGILIILALGVITTYTDYIVGTFKIRHPEVHSVADVGYLLFGVYWLYMTCIAGSGLLSIAIALNTVSEHGTCSVVFVVVGAIACFLLSLIQTLEKLSWLGWIGLVSVMSAIITLAAAVSVTRPSLAPQTGPWSKDLLMFGSPTFAEAANAVANVVFAFGGTPAFFTINAEMRDPRDFTKALLTCQAFVTGVYLAIGVVVYYYCGQYVSSPALGSAGILMKKVCYGIAIPALLVGAVLYTHLPAKYIFVRAMRGSKHLSSNTKTHWIVWIACVLGCTLFSFVIAEAVPVFNDLIGLVGALFGSFTSITVMGMMWLYDNSPSSTPVKTLSYRLLFAWNVFIILAGSFLMIGGTYGSIVGIISDTAAGATTQPAPNTFTPTATGDSQIPGSVVTIINTAGAGNVTDTLVYTNALSTVSPTGNVTVSPTGAAATASNLDPDPTNLQTAAASRLTVKNQRSPTAAPMSILTAPPSRSPAADDGPSILLIGMRGAGKTTLGALVASHLDLPFEDADARFCREFPGHTCPSFVKEFGWPAFRAAETKLLQRIVEETKREGGRKVVSLGGGIVEEEENRRVLKEYWGGDADNPVLDRKRGVVIHVFREIEQVFSEPDKVGGRKAPAWKQGSLESVWVRRRPWLRECSSHEFVNFTNSPLSETELDEDEETKAFSHRMRFESVERDFIRFFRRILSPYSPTPPPLPFASRTNSRTYLVTLPFTDITPHVPSLHTLCTGASAIELRADLLDDPHPHPRPGVAEAYENPSLSYISEQHASLRRHAPDIPIVFTLRTPHQGGRYPYPSDASEEALFATLHHALKLGTDLIDLEQGLDPKLTARVVRDAKVRGTTVVIAWRDVVGPAQGGFSWAGEEAKERYRAAVEMGADIVKIVGTASDVQDNFLLRVFAFSQLVKDGPPLSAYNMGPYGRMSRFLNPLLASVTHPLAREGTKRGIVGAPSMTFKEVQMALHLSGLISRKHFVPFEVGGVGGVEEEDAGDHARMVALREFCTSGFDELGLPYELLATEKQAGFRTRLEFYKGEPFFAGGVVSDGIGSEALECMDEASDVAQEVGGVDAFVLVEGEDGKAKVKGSHVFTNALLSVFEARLSPSNAVSPSSFAIILSSTFSNLALPSTSPFSMSTHLPSSSNSLVVRSVLAALARLGIRQMAVVDPSLDDMEQVAARKPTIVISLGGGDELEEDSVLGLLGSPTGGVVVNLAPTHGKHSPTHTTLLSVAQDEPHRRRGWIVLSSAEVNEEFSRELFRFWTGRTSPRRSLLLPKDA
ncbi:aldolase [Pseudohyphozyma bogoriensis]|nr:aldolase [Pseudohyphozyma bogoriensis]